MATTVSKKTFSLQEDIASHLSLYSNKSKFVNEALTFYINYLESTKQHQADYLEQKIHEALEGEFYNISTTSNSEKNTPLYKDH